MQFHLMYFKSIFCQNSRTLEMNVNILTGLELEYLSQTLLKAGLLNSMGG